MPIPVGLEARPKTFHGSWCFYIPLANITAAGDVITDFTPGFAGSITKWYFIVNRAVTTGGRAATLNLEINAVDVQTSAPATNSTIALSGAIAMGTVTAGSVIARNNAFDRDDTVSVEATSVTAFAEGHGTLVIEYEGKTTVGMTTGEAGQFESKPGTFHGSWCLWRTLSDISAADVFTNWTPGFAGRIVKWYWVFMGGTPGVGKAATLNLEIGAVNIESTTPAANSTIALTTANCTTLGTVTNGSVIGSHNNFDADDTISVEASSVTAFTGGVGVLIIEYEGKVAQDVVSPTQFQVRPRTFHGSWCLTMYAPSFANGDIITDFTPGFAGRITKTYWLVDQAMAAAGKTTTLNLEINAINLTGGTVVIASNTLTTKGAVQAGADITGNDKFDRDDTISVEASSTTTHTDTTYGTLVIEYEGKIL